MLSYDETSHKFSNKNVRIILCVKGIEPSLRNEVWKFLLGYYPWDSTFIERQNIVKKKTEEYFIMKLQWRSMTPIQENNFADYRERKSLIEKDVNRTDRAIPFYAGDDNPNLSVLSDILMTYIMYNFDLGYVQGMSDLLSPILCQLGNEVDAFWCFVGFMDKVSNNFDLDQAGMKEQLEQLHTLLSFAEPELASYLRLHDSGNMFFCFRWLLVLFKREFSLHDIMTLWEVLWTGLPCKNFHLLLCVAILETEKIKLMDNNYGFTEILKHVNDLSQNIELQWMLSKAEGIYHQITVASHLTDTVRIIMGIKPVGGSDNADSTLTSSVEDDSIETHNSIENVTCRPDLSEVAFERSIDLSYL